MRTVILIRILHKVLVRCKRYFAAETTPLKYYTSFRPDTWVAQVFAFKN
jgi:hypothetical protein